MPRRIRTRTSLRARKDQLPRAPTYYEPAPIPQACFVVCPRCMGHGCFYFVGYGRIGREVYSRFDAFGELYEMAEDPLCPLDLKQLIGQVERSELPYWVPPQVEEWIRSSYEREQAKLKGSKQVVDPDRVTVAVHEFLLKYSGRPELQEQ